MYRREKGLCLLDSLPQTKAHTACTWPWRGDISGLAPFQSSPRAGGGFPCAELLGSAPLEDQLLLRSERVSVRSWGSTTGAKILFLKLLDGECLAVARHYFEERGPGARRMLLDGEKRVHLIHTEPMSLAPAALHLARLH